MNHITEKIDLRLRPLLNKRHTRAFDNLRTGNLYENRLDKVAIKLYDLDNNIFDQLKQDIRDKEH